MIKTIILIFSVLIFFPKAYAQTLANKNKEELIIMKQESIDSEDYLLAKKITLELDSRITIDEKIIQKNAALKEAISQENYTKAEKLKKEISLLKANKIKIKQLEEEKRKALTIEDYDKVIEIDKEIGTLKNGEIPQPKKNDQVVVTPKVLPPKPKPKAVKKRSAMQRYFKPRANGT